MLNIEGEYVLMVDSDSHVIESESTWAYLAPSEERFRPRLVESDNEPGQQRWVLDGKEVGFRPRDRTEQELVELSERVGVPKICNPRPAILGKAFPSINQNALCRPYGVSRSIWMGMGRCL